MRMDRRDLLLGAAAMLPLPVLAAAPAPMAFDEARGRWRTLLVGDGGAIRPAVRDRIVRAAEAAAVDALARLAQGQAGGQPFPDVALGTSSAGVTIIFRRLRAIALAHVLPGTSLTGNARAREWTLSGLRWMAEHVYAPGTRFYDNWWDWQIGAPQALTDTLLLLRPWVAPTDLAASIDAIAHFVPDPRRRRRPDGGDRPEAETAANLLDKVIVVLGAGLLSDDAAKVALAVNSVASIFDDVTAGDGFYRDGSFVQHSNVPYIGGYGVPLITSLARMLVVLAGSPWAVPGRVDHVWRWLRDSYAPFLWDGAMMDAVRGRSVSRAGQSDRAVGRAVIAPMAVLADAAPPADRAWIAAAVKGWVTRGGVADRAGGTLYEASRLSTILADPAVPARPEPAGVAIFPAMARGVARGEGWALSIALFSRTIVAFEYGNGENPHGWWTGMGMTQILDGDATRYDGGYYPAVDWRRMPGTTTDHGGTDTPRGWGGGYFNPQAWVGGAVLDGAVGSLGMTLDTRLVTGGGLTALKSWFMWGGAVVAVGSAIRGGAGPVETVIENAKVAAGAEPRLTVDGTAVAVDGVPRPRQARWLHLATSERSAGTGVALLVPAAVTALLERRSGRWRDINRDGPTDVVAERFLSVGLPHRAGDGYAYALLPNRSAAATAAFAAAAPIELLAADERVHAVRDRMAGILAVHFFAGDGGTVPGAMSSSGAAAVVVRERDGEIAVAVSCPGAARPTPVTLELPRAATRAIALDAGVTLLAAAPTLRLRVEAGAATVTARLALAR